MGGSIIHERTPAKWLTFILAFTVKIGDFVLVPVGKDKHEAVAKVVNIEYFSEENVPLPVEKTKRIICKCTDKDFPHPQSK